MPASRSRRPSSASCNTTTATNALVALPMFHGTSGSTGPLAGSSVGVPAETSVIVPSAARNARRAPTNSPTAWCNSRMLLSVRRIASASDVGGAPLVGGAELVGAAALAGGAVSGVVGGASRAGRWTLVLGVASASEEYTVAASRSPTAATVAAAWAT